ncbi:hypothetical protein ACFWEB_32785 [Streptomyces parvus]|uniref:hypothetical protein n=1 Tax=Streptomyces parvus TaxID=66428 RepID=UPI0035E39EFC
MGTQQNTALTRALAEVPGARDLVVPARPRIVVTPFQTCDDCDRAFRSPTPGHCRDCREIREYRGDDVRVAA